MKKIRQRNLLFGSAAGFGILAGILIFIFGLITPGAQTGAALAVVLAATGAMAGLWLMEYRKRKTALLITQNNILHIRSAVISNSAGMPEESEDAESIEVFVSYFGILLDSKPIRFSHKGIRLRAVEFGHDFISLTCGTKKWTRNIRLLRPAIDSAAMAEISERFRYETGIVPVLLS